MNVPTLLGKGIVFSRVSIEMGLKLLEFNHSRMRMQLAHALEDLVQMCQCVNGRVALTMISCSPSEHFKSRPLPTIYNGGLKQEEVLEVEVFIPVMIFHVFDLTPRATCRPCPSPRPIESSSTDTGSGLVVFRAATAPGPLDSADSLLKASIGTQRAIQLVGQG